MISAAKIVVQPTKTGNVTDKNGHLTNKNRGLSTKNSDSINNNWWFHQKFGHWPKFFVGISRRKTLTEATFWSCWPTLYVGSGLRPPGPGGRWFTQKMKDSRWKFLRRLRLLNGREEWLISLQRRCEEYGRCRINHIHFFAIMSSFHEPSKIGGHALVLPWKSEKKSKALGGEAVLISLNPIAETGP